MNRAASPSLVFETLEGLRLVVSYQSATGPSDAEWDAWLSATRALEQKAPIFRLLAVTEGGHPSRQQMERLRTAAGRSTPRTALVSPSTAVRFVASAVLLFNPSIRCYSPADYAKAFAYLGLTPEEGAVAEAAIARLRPRIRT